jgi:hypothetical protein
MAGLGLPTALGIPLAEFKNWIVMLFGWQVLPHFRSGK